ncbi:hypothetical protein, partial [Staphylococcus capitis]
LLLSIFTLKEQIKSTIIIGSISGIIGGSISNLILSPETNILTIVVGAITLPILVLFIFNLSKDIVTS